MPSPAPISPQTGPVSNNIASFIRNVIPQTFNTQNQLQTQSPMVAKPMLPVTPAKDMDTFNYILSS